MDGGARVGGWGGTAEWSGILMHDIKQRGERKTESNTVER